MARPDRSPFGRFASGLTTPRLGLLLAALWIGAALPDLVQTFEGNRPTNDVSISPAWLKAARDLFTLALTLGVCQKAPLGARRVRLATSLVAGFYAALAVVQGTEITVAVRGVIWLFPLAWTWTATARATNEMRGIIRAALVVIVPAGLITSLVLGFAGVGMYYEAIGPYERNPGLLLSPSATAFVACAAFLFAGMHEKRLRFGALLMGLLSVSGVFYLNVVLLFGKLPRAVYAVLALAFAVVLVVLGVDGVIEVIANLNGGLRAGSSVNATLAARTVIFASAFDTFSPLGNYPLGLNVAANNDIEQFFPDNAYLAAGYAFGFVGIAASMFMTVKAALQKNFGTFILLLTASMFYVWFENALFCLIVGCMLNSHWAARPARPLRPLANG